MLLKTNLLVGDNNKTKNDFGILPRKIHFYVITLAHMQKLLTMTHSIALALIHANVISQTRCIVGLSTALISPKYSRVTVPIFSSSLVHSATSLLS